MTQTAMRANLLQALQIVTELGIQVGGSQLRVFAINNVLLSVKEPVGHFVLQWVRDDGYNLVNLSKRKNVSEIVNKRKTDSYVQ